MHYLVLATDRNKAMGTESNSLPSNHCPHVFACDHIRHKWVRQNYTSQIAFMDHDATGVKADTMSENRFLIPSTKLRNGAHAHTRTHTHTHVCMCARPYMHVYSKR